MFDKILIANRGEISCRIIQTARRLGVKTVAVCSDADRAAKHVALADETIWIGGAAPQESYLRADRIIEAALTTGAEAVHPGYGFLSENPDFVEQVEAAGLCFIGPSSAAIRAMGLKDAAKALMQQAGVPVVPGYHGGSGPEAQSPAHLMEQAERIGTPLLIKAVAGGGGKGMRLVEDLRAFPAALEAARSEAVKAFGNGDVLLEKFIQNPRHIEMQIFGDGRRAVHLFERDCSLQRRHQKVIEEAPAPGMTPELRAAMGKAAVRAAEAIGYAGAGTVEFIVDGSGGGTGVLHPDCFWFMEMNTRLQVEHPVTELITGIDLVEWQLRVASGEALPLAQDEIAIQGHAFEARLYAEDAAAGFLPATGQIAHLQFPQDIRVDSGVRAGDVISPWYDPMIAKLVTHGADRQSALRELRRALEQTEVAGLVTNLGFLASLSRHAGFAAAQIDTGLIGRDLPKLLQRPALDPLALIAAAQAALGLDGRAPEPQAGFALWGPLRLGLALRHVGQAYDLSVEVLSPAAQRWSVGAQSFDLELSQGQWCHHGKAVPAARVHGPAGTEITVFAQQGLVFERDDPLARGSATEADPNQVDAPMPGVVKAVFVTAGQQVAEGARLLVLEAMKMEHTLLAGRAGRVAEMLAAEGQQVEAGEALVRLSDVASGGGAASGS